MDFIFADDARQDSPSRPGMGPLNGIGGILVPGQEVRSLEKEVNTLCDRFKFPPGEPFKWSPGRELWMHKNLVRSKREEFFTSLLTLLETMKVKALVVIEDTEYRPATPKAPSAEVDVARLFIERAHHELGRHGGEGVIVTARPRGSRLEEDAFLIKCFETLEAGTKYVKPDRIALNVLSSPAKLIRLLQVADIVASCSIAAVAGENRYAPPIFEMLKRILAKDTGRIGGVGLKIHPNYIYANLYHWLLGDSHFWRGNVGSPFPIESRPYSVGPRTR